MNSNVKLFILLFLLIILSLLYKRFEEKKNKKDSRNNYELIQNYLLNDTNLSMKKKPILWIHVPYEYNSRNWINFASRSSYELNQPYLYLTVKSIIHHCGDSFNIIIIDDNSFKKLLPNWKIDMKKIENPICENIRRLAISKLIYNYGGLLVPISFLCITDLKELYERGTKNNKMFICENINKNITSTTELYSPDIRFIGSEKNNKTIIELIDFIQLTINKDYTSESIFLGEFNRWINDKVKDNDVNLISGIYTGIKTINDKPIKLEDLMSQNFIDFYMKMYGIWIPSEDILKRRHYEWYSRLSVNQVLESNIMLSKYILISNFHNKKGILIPTKKQPEWIGFWNIPLNSSYWGLKPNYLGNNLIKH